MSKLVHVFIICFLSFQLSAQDEYEQKKKEKPVEPVDTRIDSIEIDKPKVDKKKKNEEVVDNSKAFEGISDFKRNIRLGGGFNLGSIYYQDASYSGQLFVVTVSPQITYLMSKYFEGGLTTSYSYMGSFNSINAHSISVGPILRAYPMDEFFLQVEGVGFYNHASRDGFLPYNSYNINAFVGGGFISRFSETSYLLTGVKVNLMKNELTNNQIIPIGFTSIHFGLW